MAILSARGSGKILLANKLFSTSLPTMLRFSGDGTKVCMEAAALHPTSSNSLPGEPLVVVDKQGCEGCKGENVVVSHVSTLCVTLAVGLVFNV